MTDTVPDAEREYKERWDRGFKFQLRLAELSLVYPNTCGAQVDARYQLFHERLVEPQTRFSQNMAALQEYFPDIYEYFLNYQPTRFEAVFDGSAFNILNLADESFVYPEDGVRYALHQFEVFHKLPAVTQYFWPEETTGLGQNYIHVRNMNRMTKWWGQKDYFQHLHPGHMPETVHSAICFGVGLGVQIEEWVRSNHIHNLYLIEPEPDFFYASLYVTDWSSVFEILAAQGSCLHISLELSEQESFDDVILGFMANSYYGISFSHILTHYRSPIIDKILESFSLKSHALVSGFGFYDDSRLALAHAWHNFNSGIHVHGRAPSFELSGRPVLICANGPSLADYYDILKQAADGAIIVSCGTALSALHRMGITPHIHVESERPKQTAELLAKLGDPEYLSKIKLLVPDVIHPDVPKMFAQVLCFPKWHEAPATLLQEYGLRFAEFLFGGPTVTNFALAVLTHMGMDHCYLLGADFGFPDRQHHAPESLYYSEEKEDKGVFSYEWHAKHKRPGARGGMVETSSVLDGARLAVEAHLRKNPQVQCWNGSRGAAISGTDVISPQQLSDFLSAVDSAGGGVNELWNRAIAQAYTISDDTLDYFREVVTEGTLEALIDDVLELLQGDAITNRIEALQQLQRVYGAIVQPRCLHQGFVKAMLRGTALYMSSFILKYTLWPEDMAEGVACYREAVAVYRDYLMEIRDSFAQQWQSPDDEDTSRLWQPQ